MYGIALHGGHNPGYPASRGCIRLPVKFAELLYAVTPLHARVVILDEAPLTPEDALAAARAYSDTSLPSAEEPADPVLERLVE